jgi:endonuclease-8
MWDDGLVLDTFLKNRGEWHVYRQGAPWRRSWDQVRASIQTEEFVAVCFDAPSVETYRLPDRRRHPGAGRLGPDLGRTGVDLGEVADRLLSASDPEARLRDVLVDQHVVQGVGNVFRCEVLWATELSPWTHVGDMTPTDAAFVAETLGNMIAAHHERLRRSVRSIGGPDLAVYGRCGQGCRRCGDTIRSEPLGRSGRLLYWCPGCQLRLDRRHPAETWDIDPHPAAAKFLSDLPWRVRDAG